MVCTEGLITEFERILKARIAEAVERGCLEYIDPEPSPDFFTAELEPGDRLALTSFEITAIPIETFESNCRCRCGAEAYEGLTSFECSDPNCKHNQ